MNQDELEQFLQDEVKQHRMYPSDHIWRNIRTELHGYKAWPALTFISLFIITALTVSTLLSNHPHEQPVLRTVVPYSITEEAVQPVSPIAAVSRTQNRNYFEKITDVQVTEQAFAELNSVLATNRSQNTDLMLDIVLQPLPNNRLADGKIPVTPTILHTNEQAISQSMIPSAAVFTKEETPTVTVDTKQQATTVTDNSVTEEKQNEEPVAKEIFPATDESAKTVATAFVKPRNKSRLGFQFYITPSTSYRKLSDEKVREVIQPAVAAASQQPNVPLTGSNGDVNNVVRHRPAIGFEVGMGITYSLGPRITFKTGLQLNVRQYHIETFQSLTNEQASVSLINFRGVETISLYSPYNNNTGYKETELDNKVYQISVPMGLQWDVIKGKSLGFSAEASVQPTMMLNNNTYLLSTDYKHYADGNQFMRKWNINTSVGLNLSYKAGSTSWQIGPQIRYQHLPTYSNAYPITEHLLDYGVRIGFTKQLK